MGDNSYYGQKKPPPPSGAIDQGEFVIYNSNSLFFLIFLNLKLLYCFIGKIFVGGLSWQTTEESLRWHFEQYGPVVSVEVMRDRVTGDPRGFAFVVFREPNTVDLVMNEAKHEINHKIVDVKRAQARGVAPPSIHDGSTGSAPLNATSSNNSGQPPQQQQPHVPKPPPAAAAEDVLSPEQLHNKVFVGGIPAHIDRDGLRQLFEQFGPVTDAIVMIDQVTNRSRCFGFVTFENGSNGAQRAIDAQPLQVGQRSVEVKLATPKAEQKRMPPTSAGPKHVGLRAGMMSASSSSGEYAGLAVAYGRSGWKAGYGSKAFGKAGWAVEGWDDGGYAPPRDGFSFDLLFHKNNNRSRSHNASSSKRHRDRSDGPPSKRSRHNSQ
jgi:RNA-binding protein Musashi